MTCDVDCSCCNFVVGFPLNDTHTIDGISASHSLSEWLPEETMTVACASETPRRDELKLDVKGIITREKSAFEDFT